MGTKNLPKNRQKFFSSFIFFSEFLKIILRLHCWTKVFIHPQKTHTLSSISRGTPANHLNLGCKGGYTTVMLSCLFAHVDCNSQKFKS